MAREEKVELVRELREDIENSSALLLTDYRGLRVSEITSLRRKLREAGAEYRVVKNTLFQLAGEGTVDTGITQYLEGPTAIAFVKGDPIATAKALVDFARIHKAMSLKGGLVDGHVYGADGIQALSKVPPKDVLISQLLGSIQSPITNMVGTLQGVLSSLVFTLQGVADKKAA